MSLAQRLAHLERVEEERDLVRGAEWLAERHGVSVDEVLRSMHERAERIERWGLDAEVRRLARELGLSEHDFRAKVGQQRAAWEAWHAEADAQFGSDDADQGRGR